LLGEREDHIAGSEKASDQANSPESIDLAHVQKSLERNTGDPIRNQSQFQIGWVGEI
jgi:hypothetical protein